MEPTAANNVLITQPEIPSQNPSVRSKRRDTASPTSIKNLLDTLGKDTLTASKKSSQRNENSRKTISPNQMKQFLQEIQGMPFLDKPTKSSEETRQKELNTAFTEAFFSSELLPSADKSDDKLSIQKSQPIISDKSDGRDLTLEPDDAQAFLEELKRTENELMSKQIEASTSPKLQESIEAGGQRDRRTLDVEELYAMETAIRKEQSVNQEADEEYPQASTPPRLLLSEEVCVDVEIEPLNHISTSLERTEEPMDIDIERKIVEEFAELRAATLQVAKVKETKSTEMENPPESIHLDNRSEIISNQEKPSGPNLVPEKHYQIPIESLTETGDEEAADSAPSSSMPTSQSLSVVTISETDNGSSVMPQMHPTDVPAKTRAESLSLYSPPPTRLQTKVSLRSCLSSVKKPKRLRELTPNKTVNFGPPQGIEFNYGSPVISMTPMCANTAKAMFPVEQASTASVSSDEDMETSLNTSILDNANAQSESSDEEKERKHEPQQRSSTENAPKQRRFSLKGVTPLENIANARRQRRNSIGVKQSTPTGSLRNSDSQNQKDAQPSQSVVLQPQSRLAFADSSASSDGEDMDITGEYSNHFNISAALIQRGSAHKSSEPNTSTLENAFLAPTAEKSSTQKGYRRQSSLVSSLGGSPSPEPTVELGTLEDLVTEAARLEQETVANENAKVNEEDETIDPQEMHKDDSTEINPSLENLDDTVADEMKGSQTRSLDPISEGDENSVTSTSMMSVVVSEDEDTLEHRKSVVVNLSSHFNRMESTTTTISAQKDQSEKVPEIVADTHAETPKSKKKQFQSPPRVTRTNRTCEQLYEMLQLDAIDLDTIDSKVPNLSLLDDIDTLIASCCNAACSELIETSIDELTTWNSAMDESLVLISKELVSAAFGSENLPLDVIETIQAVGRTTADTMQSEFYQWREKAEKNCIEKLTLTLSKMEQDVKQLHGQISTIKEFELNELEALEELVDKERKWSQLLDAMEEQEGVEMEYKQTMQELQEECSSLRLDTSVIKQRIAQAENDLETPPMQMAEIQTLSSQVFWLEQKYELQQRLTFWKVRIITSSSFSAETNFTDVIFSSYVRVDVRFGDNSHAVMQISATLNHPYVDSGVKRRKLGQSKTRPDAVCLLARHLLQTESLEAIITDANQTCGKPITATENLRQLEMYLLHCYRLFRDLRKLSTHYTLHYEDNTLWIDFVHFDSKTPIGSRRPYKFSVGFAFCDTVDLSSQCKSPQLVAQPLVETRYGSISEQMVWSLLPSNTDVLALDMLPHICARLSSISTAT
uniref:Uncharacterized protein AlNc14C54G4159 n=1 Tax=Albugo laibachii Nc14 TaxID=890382 RepID=F0WBX1_9STRA|nr:conserved hypothetical protein [Albugo laibachii Nc14]|eukprot:CCA18650.1 conserved hypothetical protein [Albugo laibachii Nc14]